MKLAIGSGTAFAGLGNRVYADERAVAARLTWWKARGAEGVVCYDTLPDFYEAPLDRFRRLKRLLDDSGVAVPAFNALRKSLHLPDLADADERRLDRCLQVCEIFRPAVIDLSVCAPLAACSEHRPPPPSGATPETLRAVAARLRRFARACASLGAAVAIELHDEGIHDTAERCLTLLALIDAPNVGVNPDLGNWLRMPGRAPRETWRDQLAALAARTIYWEVKNYRRVELPASPGGLCWPVDLAAGDIDYREAAVLLWEAGFRGWVCHEGGSGDRVVADVNYLAYMRWILDEWIGQAMTRAGARDGDP